MRGLEPIRWTCIPLAALMFLFLPPREVVVSVPGWGEEGVDTYRGLPLIWQRDSVNSGDFDIFVGPFAINAGLCLLAATCVVYRWLRTPVLNGKVATGVAAILVWASGTLAILVLVMAVVGLGYFRAFWYDPTIWDHVISDTWGWGR